MGKLDDALAEASEGSGQAGGSGLGGAINQGDVELQGGDRGATAEEQISGEGTLPQQEESGQKGRTMPTNPETAGAMEDAEE